MHIAPAYRRNKIRDTIFMIPKRKSSKKRTSVIEHGMGAIPGLAFL